MTLILTGIGFIGWVLFHILKYKSLKKWRVVDGIISNYGTETYEEAQVYSKAEMIRPIIQYTYEIEGQKYTGTKLTLEDYSLKSSPESNSCSWPSFKQNQLHTIYVNPANPNNAVLFNKMLPYRVNHYAALSIVGIFLILLGAYLNYV
jgi:hypothetical protein